MQLTQEDSGRRYTVHVNDRITLTVPETPTTGFVWQAQVDPELLRELENRFHAETTPRGAAGSRIITFEAVRPGAAVLRCDRHRAWENDAAEQFQVYVEIQS